MTAKEAEIEAAAIAIRIERKCEAGEVPCPFCYWGDADEETGCIHLAKIALEAAEPLRPVAIKYEEGKAAIINCNIHFGVLIREADDGRADILVDQSPLYASDQKCVALRNFMETTAINWLELVAPHRLTTPSLPEAER